MTEHTGSGHVSVLLDEAVEAWLAGGNGYHYIDGTFGRGGHSRALLARLGPEARLLGFDKDPQAIACAESLAGTDPRFSIEHASFATLGPAVACRDWTGAVDGILLDLGVSSPQLDEAERGFSFTHDGPLDMRMDPSRGRSAAQWLAEAEEAEIADVLKTYGEERFAKRMARAVVARREQAPFTRTGDLSEVLTQANPAWERGKHPATRAFQGIRIFINDELADLEAGLEAAVESLRVGGRLVVISFHSLEDRIVKRFMRRLAKGEAETLPRGLPIMSKPFEPTLKLLGKPVYASPEELKANPRARSAVMRIAEKLR